ncbi:protein kinase [Trypanosoma rangeli SC58]|uniref:Protein kinase n=1 Tax=Trypanosoma rangeli SC58 TaxID=429131 RepID=A0A061IXD2_TRYRA|nr:protein kinase [Trypanosoma rangeli SC58]
MMTVATTIFRHPLASKRFMMVFYNEGGDKIEELFELQTRYEAIGPIAMGTYGFVCAATDNEMVEKFSLNPPEEYNDTSLSHEERQDIYEHHTMVAVKKLRQLFERNQPRMWLCATREIQLMMAFKHDNVMSALDFFIPLGECERMTYESVDYLRHNFDSVYIVMKKMDYTLREVLESSVYPPTDVLDEGSEEFNGKPTMPSFTGTAQSGDSVDDSTNKGLNNGTNRIARCPQTHLVLHPLSCDYRMFVLYQLLRGVGYMHLCGVIHRDIKPENIMLDCNYNARVCDFGQGRDAVAMEWNGVLQTFLDNCTQWYAAPETLTLAQVSSYSGFVDQKTLHAADVWSIGCVAAEMLIGRPLFYCRRFGGVGQLNAIMSVLGELSEKDAERILQLRDNDTKKVFKGVLRQEMQQHVNTPSRLRSLLRSPYGDVDEDEIELIESLLCYDPNCRITIQEALQSRYFIKEGYEPVIDPSDTATRVRAVEANEIVDAVKGRKFLWLLFMKHHPEVDELIRTLDLRRSGSSTEDAQNSSAVYTQEAAVPLK